MPGDRVVVAVSLPSRLLERLDEAARVWGYQSRSQLVREAVEEKLEQLSGLGEGGLRVILVVSDHSEEPSVDSKVISAAYEAGESLVGLYHAVVGGGECVTVVLVRDQAAAARLAARLRGLRGVRRVVMAAV